MAALLEAVKLALLLQVGQFSVGVNSLNLTFPNSPARSLRGGSVQRGLSDAVGIGSLGPRPWGVG